MSLFKNIRSGFIVALALAVMVGMLSSCSKTAPWHGDDISGSFPTLSFKMMRASDGKTITAQDYRGKIVLLYFGYTFCPDICPNTLADMSTVLKDLGKDADKVRFLFVTVDPNRDTLPILKEYVAHFSPQVVGLRATPDNLAALAKKYRIAYAVKPAKDPAHYQVSHSSAIYVFDDKGRARLVETGLFNPEAIAGITADLHRLIAGAQPNLLQHLMSLL